MEPRGRRAHQVYRMRKAVNFMAPMGFAADFVEKTVDSLLEEYEGPQGWRFIEADSYSVLLERLLDGEEDTEVNNNQIDNAREVSTAHVSLAANDDTVPLRLPGAEDAEKIESGLNGTAIGVEEALTSSSSPPHHLARSSSGVPPLPRRQRKPCYGWISQEDSDDEEEDKVEPGTGTGTVEKNPFLLPPRKRHWLDERPPFVEGQL